VDIVVSIGLYKPLGIAGLIIGTLAANIVMTWLQLHRLRLGFDGRLEGEQTTRITARITLAALLLAGVSYGVWRALDAVLGTSIEAQIVSVGLAGLAGTYVYARAVLAMQVPEARQVGELLTSRFKRG
jgi:putative peptidoglycan lipid II flippase